MSLVVTIMQGPPGSGKSTVADALVAVTNQTVISADAYGVNESGTYFFAPEDVLRRHSLCIQECRDLLEKGLSVIVDNTNIKAWNAAPYVHLADVYGAEIQFIRVDGVFTNVHGVPPNKVEMMREGMELLTGSFCRYHILMWLKNSIVEYDFLSRNKSRTPDRRDRTEKLVASALAEGVTNYEQYIDWLHDEFDVFTTHLNRPSFPFPDIMNPNV